MTVDKASGMTYQSSMLCCVSLRSRWTVQVTLLWAVTTVFWSWSGQAQSARELDRGSVPDWSVPEGFEDDIFTFVRIEYSGGGFGGFGRRGGGGRWRVDYPNADLNFSYRLEELTSVIADPDGETMRVTDRRIFDYPFIFLIDPRDFHFSSDESENLRNYLLNGGFLMIDDFWGEGMWNHVMGEIQKVFPDRKPESLPLSHPIFNIVFPLDIKPQVPSEDSAQRGHDSGTNSTWEDEIRWETPRPADYQAILDDRGNIMILFCYNTDLSDGWEEEAKNEWFFKAFSEPLSYPMGINIVVYAMTH